MGKTGLKPINRELHSNADCIGFVCVRHLLPGQLLNIPGSMPALLPSDRLGIILNAINNFV